MLFGLYALAQKPKNIFSLAIFLVIVYKLIHFFDHIIFIIFWPDRFFG